MQNTTVDHKLFFSEENNQSCNQDGDSKELSVKDAAAEKLMKLKTNMIEIHRNHKQRKENITTLRPHKDAYEMLKYFDGIVRYSIFPVSYTIRACSYIVKMSEHCLRFFQRWGNTFKRAHSHTLM